MEPRCRGAPSPPLRRCCSELAHELLRHLQAVLPGVEQGHRRESPRPLLRAPRRARAARGRSPGVREGEDRGGARAEHRPELSERAAPCAQPAPAERGDRAQRGRASRGDHAPRGSPLHDRGSERGRVDARRGDAAARDRRAARPPVPPDPRHALLHRDARRRGARAQVGGRGLRSRPAPRAPGVGAQRMDDAQERQGAPRAARAGPRRRSCSTCSRSGAARASRAGGRTCPK